MSPPHASNTAALVAALSSQQHLSVTQIFRRLEIVGKGAYGSVHRGVHVGTGVVVALKIINLDTADDDVAEIQREVALLSQLRGENTNVTQYYGCWLEGPRVWIAMDFAQGGSVRTLMKANPPSNTLEERFISIITRELLVALSFLHRSNVIHRDIKAANVLITSTGRIMLCDFGVSALLASTHSKRTTLVGTPFWMAPEVISTSATYNTKADIWSLGITVYEMAMGMPPHSDLEHMRAMVLITKAKPPRLPENVGTKEMRDFVANCLRESPNDRLTADELSRTKWIKGAAKVPISSLRELLSRYDAWTQNGGTRESIAGDMSWDDEESEDLDVPQHSWEFDTIRGRSSLDASPPEESVSDPTVPSDKVISQPPPSLRMLFEDASAPPQDPFRNAVTPLRYNTPLTPMSSSSEVNLLTARRNSLDLQTARQQNFSLPTPSTPPAISARLSPVSPARIPNYREVRTSKGLANISIPPPVSTLTADRSLTQSSPQENSLEESPPRLTRRLAAEPESTNMLNTEQPRVRKGASPVNFTFPSPSSTVTPTPIKDSPPSSTSTLLAPTFSNHNPSHSLDAPRNPQHPPFLRSHTATAYSSPNDIPPRAAAAPVGRPSMTRQASVAVMETVQNPPRPRRVGRQPSTDGEMNQSSLAVPKGPGLRDVLKASPMSSDLSSGGIDMLPPSPSAISPVNRYFTPSPSSLNTSATPTDNFASNSTPSALPTGSEGRIPASESSFLHSSNNLKSLGSSLGSMSFGPAIRPLDYNRLFSSEDVHAEIARTVEELSQWLSVVDSGLASILDRKSDDESLVEIEEELEPYSAIAEGTSFGT